MELTQLQTFLKVAACGAMTKAAEQLCLTQPAVSQQIRSLEAELGVTLFERLPRGMRLTPAGDMLHRYAQQCLASIADCQLALQDFKSGAVGSIAIGAGVTTSIFKLPEWLRVYRSVYPQFDVIVRTGRSSDVLALLEDGEIDLALITTPGDSPHLQLSPLFDEKIVLVVPADHALAGKPLTAERITELPLILFPPGTGFRIFIDSVLTSAGVTPLVKMEIDSVEAIKRFVEVGLGASFLPEAAVEQEVREGRLALLPCSAFTPLSRTTYLGIMANRYLTRAMRAFIALVSS